MNLKNKKSKISLVLIAALTATIFTYVVWTNVGPKNIGLSQVNQEYSLVCPVFGQSMSAATSYLDNESGMSVFLNLGTSIDITQAAAYLTNIENQTSDWVVGSVPLSSPPFTPSDYPHCFVHKNGWIVVYYLRATSQNGAYVSFMIAWKTNSESFTAKSPLDEDKLMQGLAIVCAGLGKSTTGAQYYDFQYPMATSLLMAIKTNTVTSAATFNIEIPTTGINVLEQSWSHRDGYYGSDGSNFKIDGQLFDQGVAGPSLVTYGELPLLPLQSNPLKPGSFHEIYVDGRANWCGICLTILYN